MPTKQLNVIAVLSAFFLKLLTFRRALQRGVSQPTDSASAKQTKPVQSWPQAPAHFTSTIMSDSGSPSPIPSFDVAPESYLAIIPPCPKSLRPDTKDSLDSETRRVQKLLDGLASICVSQGSGEGYSTAIALFENSSTIFISGNYGDVPEATQTYLSRVCSRLSEVANLAGDHHGHVNDLPVDARNAAIDVHKMVVLFTFPNLIYNLREGEAPWDERISEVRSQVGHRDEKLEEQLNGLTEKVKNLREVAYSFDPTSSDVVPLLRAIQALDRESDKEMKLLIKQIDSFPVLKEAADPFSIAGYLRKVVEVLREPSRLIRLVASSRHGHIFKQPPTLKFVTNKERYVELDVPSAVQTAKSCLYSSAERESLDKFVEESAALSKTQLICRPHSESAMMLEILKRWDSFHRPLPVIGVSEPSCFACQLVFRSYESMMSAGFQWTTDSFNRDMPMEFTVRKDDDRNINLPWISPDLSTFSPVVHERVQNGLRREAVDAVRVSYQLISASNDVWSERDVFIF